MNQEKVFTFTAKELSHFVGIVAETAIYKCMAEVSLYRFEDPANIDMDAVVDEIEGICHIMINDIMDDDGEIQDWYETVMSNSK